MAGDKNKLTEKQRQILEYLKQEILQRGFPPSVREICEAVHLKSTSSVHPHLETLEKNGYIRRDPTKPHQRASQTHRSGCRHCASAYDLRDAPYMGYADARSGQERGADGPVPGTYEYRDHTDLPVAYLRQPRGPRGGGYGEPDAACAACAACKKYARRSPFEKRRTPGLSCHEK